MPHQQFRSHGELETGPRFQVSAERPENPGIEPMTPGLHGKTPRRLLAILVNGTLSIGSASSKFCMYEGLSKSLCTNAITFFF